MLQRCCAAFARLFQRSCHAKVRWAGLHLEILEDRLTPSVSPWQLDVNSLVLPSGQDIALIPTPRSAITQAVGFGLSGTVVTAYNQDGAVLWSKDLGRGQLFGGFDFERDGIPDIGIVRAQPTGTTWYKIPVDKTWISFYRGVNGQFAGATAPMADLRWILNGIPAVSHQWTAITPLFGSGPVLADSPYYATTGWFFQWNGTTFTTTGAFYYPSTPAYDATYTQAQPNPYDGTTDYMAYSHGANGLVVDSPSGPVVVFWTSGRVVQYSISPLGPDQLLQDTPFLNGGRTDLAGRNYGLVAQDPNYPDHISLLAGTSAISVYNDTISGTIAFDPWGGIERHVDIYSVSGNDAYQQVFYGSAHDDGNADQYENRVVFPENPYIRVQPGTPSRLAYNVYSQGHWYLHISQPGSTADEVVIPDVFLWDIRDFLGDGNDELIVSPMRVYNGTFASLPYFPQWKTDIDTWSEATLTLNTDAIINGGIPLITPHFRQPGISSSQGYLYAANVAVVAGAPNLILTAPTGQQFFWDVTQGANSFIYYRVLF